MSTTVSLRSSWWTCPKSPLWWGKLFSLHNCSPATPYCQNLRVSLLFHGILLSQCSVWWCWRRNVVVLQKLLQLKGEAGGEMGSVFINRNQNITGIKCTSASGGWGNVKPWILTYLGLAGAVTETRVVPSALVKVFQWTWWKGWGETYFSAEEKEPFLPSLVTGRLERKFLLK